LEDVLCVSLLCLEEDDGREAELARERRNSFNVVPFLPLKDVLCVPLLCLEEDDGREVELAVRAEAVIKCRRFIFTFVGCTSCPSPVS
jgi:hypothetical protein